MSEQHDRPIVDAIGIGGSRCGSTWIAACLAEHPDICFSKEKELHFFNAEKFDAGLAGYTKYFDHCNDTKLRAEFTPLYITSPQAAARIKQTVPDVKLIGIFRNPVERAYSQYFHSKAREKESAKTFEEALDSHTKSRYLSKGLYYSHLQPYLEHFSRDQLCVVLYDDLKKNPHAVIRTIYSFLGVDDSFVPPSVRTHVNASPVSGKLVRVPFLNNTYRWLRQKKKQHKTLKCVFRAMKRLHLDTPVRWLLTKNKEKFSTKKETKPPMKQETRQMLQQYYAQDTKQLAAFLGRNLDHWQ